MMNKSVIIKAPETSFGIDDNVSGGSRLQWARDKALCVILGDNDSIMSKISSWASQLNV